MWKKKDEWMEERILWWSIQNKMRRRQTDFYSFYSILQHLIKKDRCVKCFNTENLKKRKKKNLCMSKNDEINGLYIHTMPEGNLPAYMCFTCNAATKFQY